MATGRRAFARESAQTLAAIIEEPEPVGRTPQAGAAALDRGALPGKEPGRRYASTEDLAPGPGEPAGPSVGNDRRRSPWGSIQGAFHATGMDASVGHGGARRRPDGCRRLDVDACESRAATRVGATRLTLTLPSSAPLLVPSLVPSLALSPDGNRLVYVAASGGGLQLYMRALDQPAPAPIAGTEGGIGLFSPDGQWIGFFAGGKLKKTPLAGGAPITLCDADGAGASWGADATIVFETQNGLATISAAGGAPRKLTVPDSKKGETYHNKPVILPGSKGVLFAIWTGGSMGEQPIAVQSLSTGVRRVLSVKGACPRYAPTGHLVFVRDDGRSMAAPFDLDRLEVTGPPVPVAEGVRLEQPSGAAQYALSDGGSLVYLASDAGRSEATLVWVGTAGERSSP